ncbi:NAD(P)-binding protein [Amniculicola lignicola CBS 123094]|uniref:NAD(P)-binding protein n=1 Tax=Amniculicola lignicola CBS 123094 TaxID=1392246 RepID=A0A6A5W129_9PLEO|nr:NAD(P)-binding protein [Amniculicola lignicola CBS 123094]
MTSHRILLTGANGFIALHIIRQLLSSPSNHSIRAVVRSLSKVSTIQSLFPHIPTSKLDFAIVPDITVPGAFDSALESPTPFDIVLHTASPFLMRAAKTADDFIKPAVQGTTEILNAINRCAPSVKRVVLTSSFAAVGAWGLYDDRNKVYTEADWNPVTSEIATGADDLMFQYFASKKFAEQAAWKIAEAQGAKWDLVALCPPMVYGPMLGAVERVEDLNESNEHIWKRFFAESTPESEMSDNMISLFVDVRDIAKAHVLAMDAAEAGNKRFLVNNGWATSQRIADIFRAEVPGAAERTPKGTPGADTLDKDWFKTDVSRAERLLGMTYTPVKDTFVDLGMQLMEIEKKQKSL